MDTKISLESFITSCDGMLIAHEGFKDRIKIRVSKTKLKENDGKYAGTDSGLKYKGVPISISKKLSELDNPEQEKLIKDGIKKTILVAEKALTKDILPGLIEELLEDAANWGMDVTTKEDMLKLMNLDHIDIDFTFESFVEGYEMFPLSSSKDKETYRKENEERTAKFKKYMNEYKGDAIKVAYVDFMYNNRPNDKFFGGHTLTVSITIKDGKVTKHTTSLEG